MPPDDANVPGLDDPDPAEVDAAGLVTAGLVTAGLVTAALESAGAEVAVLCPPLLLEPQAAASISTAETATTIGRLVIPARLER